MKKRVRALFLLMLLLTVASVGYYAYSPLTLPNTPFEFSVKPGSGLKSIAREMQQDRLLDHDWPFVWMARLLGQSGQLKAGNYALEQPVSPRAAEYHQQGRGQSEPDECD